MNKSVKYYYERKNNGLCVSCGTHLEPNNKGSNCEKCKELKRKRRKEEVEFRLKNGLCVQCGRPNKEPEYKHCPKCREYKRGYMDRKFEKRHANNQCIICGGKNLVPNTKWCWSCRKKQYERNKQFSQKRIIAKMKGSK